MNDFHYEALANIMVSHAKEITSTMYTTLAAKGRKTVLKRAALSGLSPENVVDAASETVSATEKLWKACYHFLSEERAILATMCEELNGRAPAIEGNIGVVEDHFDNLLNDMVEKAAQIHVFFDE